MKKLKTLLLHMGPDKTGSTAIQHALGSNAEYFERSGVLCSPSSFQNDRNLAVAFCKSDRRAGRLFNADKKRRGASKKYLNEVQNRVAGTTADTLILSHEGLVKLNKAELIRLCSFLQALTESIHVVLYARPPGSYAISGMSQRVKTGRRAHLEYPPVIVYKDIIKRIVSVFGRECVELRRFDSKVFPSGDVVLDFLSMPVLKQLQNLDRKPLVNTFKGNPSFSRMGLLVGDRVLAILGAKAPVGQRFKALFAEDLYLLQGEKMALSPLQVLIIKTRSARHTKYLEREFGVVFSDPVLNTPGKLPDHHTSRQIELMARDLIALRLPGYRLSWTRRGWRWFLCWGADFLSGSK